MNAARYKLMLSYLPGMAAIVNSFQSPDVQKAVYESLMDALDVRLEAEAPGAGKATTNRQRVPSVAAARAAVKESIVTPDSGVIHAIDEIAHDLAEGDSIHSVIEQQHSSLP